MAKLTASTNVSEFLVSEDDAAARLSLGVDEQSLTLIADASNVVTGFGLTTIPNNWKVNQSALTALQIGSPVTSIGSSAFSYCTGFTGALIIPDSVTSIGSYAFGACLSFTGSLVIPDSVITIGSYAFQALSGLTGSLIIGTGVQTIGVSAFNSSGFSGSITIPQSVTSVGALAFGSCSNITSANIYTQLSIVNSNNCFASSGITTIHARASDATWTAGAGQDIGGQSGITVIKDL